MNAVLKMDSTIGKHVLSHNGKIIHKIGGTIDAAKTRFRYSKQVENVGLRVMEIHSEDGSVEEFDLDNLPVLKRGRRAGGELPKQTETQPMPFGEEVMIVGVDKLEGELQIGVLIGEEQRGYVVEFTMKEGIKFNRIFNKTTFTTNDSPYHNWKLELDV